MGKSRSRDRSRSLDGSHSKERNRSDRQARGRMRSRSRESDNGLLPDLARSENPLLRKDDDYTEIDVKKGSNIKQSASSKIGRLAAKKTQSEGGVKLFVYFIILL